MLQSRLDNVGTLDSGAVASVPRIDDKLRTFSQQTIIDEIMIRCNQNRIVAGDDVAVERNRWTAGEASKFAHLRDDGDKWIVYAARRSLFLQQLDKFE